MAARAERSASAGSGDPADGRKPIRLALLAGPGLTRDLAEQLTRTLPPLLSERFAEVEWQVEVAEEPLAGATTGHVDLVDLAHRRLLEEGWDLAIVLTDAPVLVDRRPVTAHASMTHGVGLVSVPALGAVSLDTRVETAVLRLVESLLGERLRGRPRRERRLRRKRIRGRLEEMASPVGEARAHEGTIQFVTAVVRGNLRLLIGMVRANRPWRLVAGLSRALTAALGTGAFGIVSPGVWIVADGLGWLRSIALCVGSVVVTCAALIVRHRLWEHAPSPEARERVVLFNLATTLTVAIGILTLFAALLAIAVVCMAAVVAASVMTQQLHHPVGVDDYLKVSLIVTALATVGGALGSALENDQAVREAAYGYRAED